MSDVCSVDIIIKSVDSKKLRRLKGALISNIKNDYGERTLSHGSCLLRDVDVSSDPREGEDIKTLVIHSWVDWGLENEAAVDLFSFFRSFVDIHSDFECTVYYDELGSDQYGMYKITGRYIEDISLSSEIIDSLRSKRDAKENEDEAWEEYQEELNNALHNTDIPPVIVHTFPYPEGRCPKCGSDNLDFEPLESDYLADGATVWWPVECMDCRHKFNQIYRLKYEGTEDVSEY